MTAKEILRQLESTAFGPAFHQEIRNLHQYADQNVYQVEEAAYGSIQITSKLITMEHYLGFIMSYSEIEHQRECAKQAESKS